ncbi:hypothetical protein T440DRAFT_12568 [Plenodomus tracheiphilus IPT5]|uniref:Uncharacterized protein n=1 Tax=Plenodomus tracheiphilus IPT5 TaxID=1408161 RepID=A0A6A7BNE8_9PLEO|nr:hypothetical protein T440DRAFT_12568 [Plenodomus tracheiphilus IPT5]
MRDIDCVKLGPGTWVLGSICLVPGNWPMGSRQRCWGKVLTVRLIDSRSRVARRVIDYSSMVELWVHLSESHRDETEHTHERHVGSFLGRVASAESETQPGATVLTGCSRAAGERTTAILACANVHHRTMRSTQHEYDEDDVSNWWHWRVESTAAMGRGVDQDLPRCAPAAGGVALSAAASRLDSHGECCAPRHSRARWSALPRHGYGLEDNSPLLGIAAEAKGPDAAVSMGAPRETYTRQGVESSMPPPTPSSLRPRRLQASSSATCCDTGVHPPHPSTTPDAAAEHPAP